MSIETLITNTTEEELQDMASGLHGVVGTRLARFMGEHAEENSLGYVVGDSIDFDIPGLGTKLKRPDAAFISIEKMPEPIDDVIPFAPDIAVEVISRTDGWKETLDKANLYLQAGTLLVWAVDPYSKSVFVFEPDGSFDLLKETEELDGKNILPGFKLGISKLFRVLKPKTANPPNTSVS